MRIDHLQPGQRLSAPAEQWQGQQSWPDQLPGGYQVLRPLVVLLEATTLATAGQPLADLERVDVDADEAAAAMADVQAAATAAAAAGNAAAAAALVWAWSWSWLVSVQQHVLSAAG